MPTINSPTPDATTASKGKIQLAGDLTGTSSAPTLSASAISLGYQQVTAGQSVTATTPTQFPGLSVPVTIPAGGRRVKITFFTWAITVSTAVYVSISIWDGTVGTGTQIGEAENLLSASAQNSLSFSTIITPSAGAKTYNIGMKVNTGSAAINGKATAPTYVLVELI